MAKYQLTIDEDQLRALVVSTEAYSRLCTGQLMYALEQAWDKQLIEMPSEQSRMLESKLRATTLLLSKGQYDGYSGSAGIYNKDIHPAASVAYNIHQVLRNQQYKDRYGEDGKGPMTTDSSVTICNGETPITIEKVED